MRKVPSPWAALAFLDLCLAQDAAAPTTRSQVRDERRAAQQAHQLKPARGGAEPSLAAPTPSNPTQAQRKTETLQARKEEDLQPAGPRGVVKAERPAAATRSTKARAERKAQTLAAVKAGQFAPAGEGASVPRR